jgi:hypothetical protein
MRRHDHEETVWSWTTCRSPVVCTGRSCRSRDGLRKVIEFDRHQVDLVTAVQIVRDSGRARVARRRGREVFTPGRSAEARLRVEVPAAGLAHR